MHSLALVLLYFFIYAFLGWVAEVIYGLVVLKKLNDPGFLRLPLLPIYGIGSVAIVFLIEPYVPNPFLVFIASLVVATVVEYLTHLLLDKLFHLQLWNYDDKAFNIQGRVAPGMSILFGVLALLLVYVIHPVVFQLANLLPELFLGIVVITLSSLVVLDATNAVSSLARLRLSKIKGTIEDVQEAITAQLAKLSLPPSSTRVRAHRAKRLFLRLHNLNIQRLQRAFPNARVSERKAKR